MSDLGTARGRIVIDASDVKRAQKEVEQASRGITSALNAIGIGVGAREFVQFAVAADSVATSYLRQSVAARTLAGSQEQLNTLLETYDEATGGAVDKASALSNVTKLLAVGFADSAAELDQFATAIRGISIAMGTTQDFATQNLILELFSQRGARLDQLGLQYEEVRKRADELRIADSSLTETQAYQNAVLEQAIQRFGGLADSAAGQKTSMEELTNAWKDFRLEVGLTGAIDFVAEAMTNWLTTARRDIKFVTDAIQELEQAWDRLRYAMGLRGTAIGAGAFDSPGVSSSGSIGGRGPAGSIGGASGMSAEDAQKLLDAQLEYSRGLSDIARETGQAIQDATEQFGRQRAETIRSYELSIAREAEDFARSRLRQQRDYERSILEVVRDARAREAEWAEDLGEQIAEARQKSNERIREMEADYTKRRERAQADHNDKLLDAAGRLDAEAVYRAQRDFARSQKEAEEDNKERLDKERDNLQESLDEANKAHQERLEDAREADRQRLEDMRLALEQQRADEDEDRRIRQERAKADHETALTQQAADHQANLTRIAREEADRLEIVTRAFEDEMIALGLHNVAVEAERKRAQKAELEAIAPQTKEWFNTLRDAMAATFPNHPSSNDPYVDRLLPSNTHSSGSIGPSGSRSGPITFNIYGAIGQSVEQLGEIIEDKIIEVFERGAN